MTTRKQLPKAEIEARVSAFRRALLDRIAIAEGDAARARLSGEEGTAALCAFHRSTEGRLILGDLERAGLGA